MALTQQTCAPPSYPARSAVGANGHIYLDADGLPIWQFSDTTQA